MFKGREKNREIIKISQVYETRMQEDELKESTQHQ